MKKLKAVTRFLLIFIVSYVIFMMPQLGIRNAFTGIICNMASKAFHTFGETGMAQLQRQTGTSDIKILISNSTLIKAGRIIWFNFSRSSNTGGYLHTAFLLSLIFATPLSLKRKLIAFGIGFFSVLILILIRLRLIISYCCAITPDIGLYQDAAENKSAIFWHTHAGITFTPFYTVVILIWFIACIGKKEWQQLNGVFTEQISNKQQKGKPSVARRK